METTTPRIANFMSESPKQLSRQVSVDKKDSEALPSAFYNALESLKLGRDLNSMYTHNFTIRRLTNGIDKQPRALMASYKGVEAKTVGI